MNNIWGKQKRNALLTLGALIIAVALAGCGNTAAEDLTATGGMADSSEHGSEWQEDTENPAAGNRRDDADKTGNVSENDALGLKYMESLVIEDYYGDKAEYEIYVPKGCNYEDGIVTYYEHGLTFSASVIDCGSSAYIKEFLTDSLGFWTNSWKERDYTDVEIGDVLECGNNYYQIASAKQIDIFDIPYSIKHVYYADVKKEDGLIVLWNIELFEPGMDEETDLILNELAQCYGLNAEEIKLNGEWAIAYKEYIHAAETQDSLPETVLWFNATYAPLTQSNKSFGTNWKLVGGMRATEDNAEFCQEVLSRDWEISDAVSALETIESLKEKGHREKCRQCMEELAEMGLLDADEETFFETLVASETEENPYRYVIAYYMHKNGMNADDIAAWDLCRVNQLYADFYICGYMTYEEAMDASLENSLILQEMYSSWEDLVNSYLLGYQFWRGDLALTEDSPTQQRFQCYIELLEMEDGPYTLDWNMDLSKSW